MCKLRPDDPDAYLHNGLAADCLPARIAAVSAAEVLGPDGSPVVEARVHCVFRGRTELCGAAVAGDAESWASPEADDKDKGSNRLT